LTPSEESRRRKSQIIYAVYSLYRIENSGGSRQRQRNLT
jgi:hypothetical protein